MKSVGQICEALDALFPPGLAESWDNTGLLVGDRGHSVQRAMGCLTITPVTAAEAIAREADLIVAHHPLPFRPLQQITSDTVAGRLLWQLIGHSISVYSPHTRFDSASFGINQFIAERLNLQQIDPLSVAAGAPSQGPGSGRIGRLSAAQTWNDFAQAVKKTFGVGELRGVVPDRPRVERIAVACGSGGALVGAAIDRGSDVLVTGEMSFHSCLECQAHGMGVVLLGHFSSERFGIERLMLRLQEEFSDLEVWASQRETDPISLF